MIPKPVILIVFALLLASWFLIVERQNFWEKIFILIGIAVVYAGFRVMTGTHIDQIFTPVQHFLFD
ncbi:MAG: hypothetical protein H6754_04955 [Candidatus Omnitrophica bacterium]|nr:hypothetical protein [Candidatus Omnitrophota bacterium]